MSFACNGWTNILKNHVLGCIVKTIDCWFSYGEALSDNKRNVYISRINTMKLLLTSTQKRQWNAVKVPLASRSVVLLQTLLDNVDKQKGF